MPPRAAAEPFVFDPLDLHTRRDPYGLYARGRRDFPVFRHHGLPLPVLSVFRHADCLAILKDADTWSSDFRPLEARLAGSEAIPEQSPRSMLGMDDPEHARLRSLVDKAFTPRIVQQRVARMREVAAELVDAALERGEVDLVQALTYPLPVTVIAEIIGVPAGDRAKFKTWSDEAVSVLGTGFFGGLDAERLRRQRALVEEMRGYFVPLAEERRREPQSDLLSGLVRAEHEGTRLSQEEMLSMLVLLLVAGNETTTTLIGNAVLALLANPETLARVRADRGLVAGAVEETLRWASPVQFDPRRASRRVELRGETIEENEVVLCWLGSANRDEAVFERPECFDAQRGRSTHLAFGVGVHFCLGANLARLEAQVALEALLSRTRRFELATQEPLPLHPSPVFRAVTSLPLRLEPA